MVYFERIKREQGERRMSEEAEKWDGMSFVVFQPRKEKEERGKKESRRKDKLVSGWKDDELSERKKGGKIRDEGS
jgi:hypothetical protein